MYSATALVVADSSAVPAPDASLVVASSGSARLVVPAGDEWVVTVAPPAAGCADFLVLSDALGSGGIQRLVHVSDKEMVADGLAATE